jgi:hypothetical protein
MYSPLNSEKIPFDYHSHPDEQTTIDIKKDSYVLSLKYFQHVFNRYDNPKVGDLVIYEMPDRSLKFKVVEAVPKTYFFDTLTAVDYYIPIGFVVLQDPQTKESKMVRVRLFRNALVT